MNYYPIIRPLIFALSPETAHHAALGALKLGLLPRQKPVHSPALAQSLFGLHWPTPVGLAAGFDKNATVTLPLLQQGFSSVEAGTITPKAQKGNDKPRLFRLTKDRAIINRMGFNNDGIESYRQNLQQAYGKRGAGIIGANVGRNKNSANDASDFIHAMERIYPFCDYITINISSPNTPGLREIQGNEFLDVFLQNITDSAKKLADTHQQKRPIFLKIAPDISPNELPAMLDTITKHAIDGLIVSNTTLSRHGLTSPLATESGGMSGQPLHQKSCDTIKACYQHTGGNLPIIGVGGIHDAASAYQTIRAGASLVQLYSALIYQGFSLVPQIQNGLEKRLKIDGYTTITQAIGADA